MLAAAGKGEEAARWHDQARAAYRTEAEAGNGGYYYHLAEYNADSGREAAEAVRWARKDLETRRSGGAWDALGWALYQAGDYTGAVEAQGNALAQGTRNAHALLHAAWIYSAAGEVGRGGEYRKRPAGCLALGFAGCG